MGADKEPTFNQFYVIYAYSTLKILKHIHLFIVVNTTFDFCINFSRNFNLVSKNHLSWRVILIQSKIKQYSNVYIKKQQKLYSRECIEGKWNKPDYEENVHFLLCVLLLHTIKSMTERQWNDHAIAYYFLYEIICNMCVFWVMFVLCFGVA